MAAPKRSQERREVRRSDGFTCEGHSCESAAGASYCVRSHLILVCRPSSCCSGAHCISPPESHECSSWNIFYGPLLDLLTSPLQETVLTAEPKARGFTTSGLGCCPQLLWPIDGNKGWTMCPRSHSHLTRRSPPKKNPKKKKSREQVLPPSRCGSGIPSQSRKQLIMSFHLFPAV